MKLKNILPALLVGASIFTFTGCSSSQNQYTFGEGEVFNLKMGTESTYPPFEFLDKSGTVQGLDIELSKKIAEAYSTKYSCKVILKVLDMDFNNLLNAVNSDQIDMIAAGFSMNEIRAKQVDFSTSYIQIATSIIVKKGTVIDSMETLKGLKVGVQMGTTMEDKADDLGLTNKTAISSNSTLIQMLINGNVDAVLMEASSASNYVNAYKDNIEISGYDLGEDDDAYSVAFKKGNTKLLEVANEVIEDLVSKNEIGNMYEQATDLFVSVNA